MIDNNSHSEVNQPNHWFSSILKLKMVKIPLIIILWILMGFIIFLVLASILGKHMILGPFDINPIPCKTDTIRIPIRDTIRIVTRDKSGYLPQKERVLVHNKQKIDSGASGFQNNAPNYGNQAARDININAERILTSEEKSELLNAVKKFQKEHGLKDSIYISVGQGASGKIVLQIKEFLIDSHYNVIIFGTISGTIEKFEVTIFPMDKNCRGLVVGVYR